jgi:hypothetical protein
MSLNPKTLETKKKNHSVRTNKAPKEATAETKQTTQRERKNNLLP